MNYVAHDCRNSRHPEYIQTGKKKDEKYPNPNFCNNRWVDKDLTGAGMLIPRWKYCKDCCEKLGIDFDKQQPSDYRTEEQNNKIKEHIKKIQTKRKQNAQSDISSKENKTG